VLGGAETGPVRGVGTGATMSSITAADTVKEEEETTTADDDDEERQNRDDAMRREWPMPWFMVHVLGLAARLAAHRS
jgi:hypothetical protein